LSAQEAAILLGLRPATLPSSAVDDSLNVPPEDVALEGGADGEVIIGLGGGGSRKSRKGRKGRKEKVEEVVQVEDVGGYPAPPLDIDADP